MPRIKRTTVTPEYLAQVRCANELFESDDCMTKALAVVTGLHYAQVHEALLSEGRKPRRGTHWWTARDALRKLGFDLQQLKTDEYQSIIDRYPGTHSNCKSITSHHPRRFPKVWQDMEPLIFDFGQHVAAFKDGVIHDWTVNKAMRAKSLYRVVPIAAQQTELPAALLKKAVIEPMEPPYDDPAALGIFDAHRGHSACPFGDEPRAALWREAHKQELERMKENV